MLQCFVTKAIMRGSQKVIVGTIIHELWQHWMAILCTKYLSAVANNFQAKECKLQGFV